MNLRDMRIGTRHKAEQAAEKSNRIGNDLNLPMFARDVQRDRDLVVVTVSGLCQIRRCNDYANVVRPS